jgi:hypothetical protein
MAMCAEVRILLLLDGCVTTTLRQIRCSALQVVSLCELHEAPVDTSNHLCEHMCTYVQTRESCLDIFYLQDPKSGGTVTQTCNHCSFASWTKVVSLAS